MPKQLVFTLAGLICAIAGSADVQAKTGSADNLLEGLLDLPLEALSQIPVLSASRYQQSIENAPAIVNIITRRDIQRYGANNLLEVLQRFPGFVPVSDATYGARGSALRGDTNISAERTLMLIDGRPYRSQVTSVYTARSLNQAFPLKAIERIELTRGPGSALYGTNAVTGVINIITRQADHSGVEVEIKAGSWDTRQGKVSAHYRDDDLAVRINADMQTSDGWESDIATIFSAGQRLDYAKPTDSAVLQAGIDYQGFSFNTLLINYESNYVRAAVDIVDDQILAQYRFYDAGYAAELWTDWQLKTHWTHTDIADSQFASTEKNDLLDITLQGKLNNSGSQLISGIMANHSTFSADDPNVIGFDGSLRYYSAFAQLEQALSDKLSGHFGLQANRVEGGDNDLSPRLGLVYQYHQGQGVKLLYNEAFRAPARAETDFKLYSPELGAVIFENSPELNSETVKTVDIQWFNYQDSHHTTVTAFRSEYKNQIKNNFNNIPPHFEEWGEVVVIGLEAEGRLKISEQDNIDWSWTWQDSKNETHRSDAALAPRWVLSTGYSHLFNNGWQFALFNQHVDGFKDSGNTINNPRPESYDLLSVNLRVPFNFASSRGGVLKPETVVAFYVSNLLDEEIWQPELIQPYFNSIQAYGGRAGYASLEISW